MSQSSASILDRFRRSRPTDIDLTLRQPYYDLLAKLGDPHLKLPPVAHVAGTNGKGSVCAFLRAAAEAAGYRAHVYTSPHLVTVHERVRVAGKLITEDELAGILLECERLAEPGAVTYFEAGTAAAFTAFARHPADVAIIEVGLGGRLDATNVIPAPAATVITRLSFDHRDYLGQTMAGIAREKAGILKRGAPCFTAPQPSIEALEALQKAAADIGVTLAVGGRDWRAEGAGENGFRFTGPRRTLDLPLPALVGGHQIENAGLAIAMLSALPIKISDDALCRAMASVEWPGRLQRLTEGRLVELLPPGWELWLDGGHNDSAGEVVAAQIEAWRRQDGGNPRPLFGVLGMLSTKTPREFLEPLRPLVDAWRTVAIENEPLSRTAEELAAAMEGAGMENVSVAEDLAGAVRESARIGEPAGRVLVCGSLYLVGEALRLNGAL